MADPISLLASIVGVIGACAKTSNALIDLGVQFSATKAAASSLAAECLTIRAILERLSSLMKSRPELLAPRGRGKTDLEPCFRGIVQAIDQGIGDLDRQISSLSRTGTPGDMNTGHRILFMFKEGSIKSTVDDIRQQRATLSMLLSCIQSEMLDDIQVQFGGSSPGFGPRKTHSSITDPSQLGLGSRLSLQSGIPGPSARSQIRIHMKRQLDNPRFAQIVSRCPKPGKSRKTDQKYLHKLHSAIANGDSSKVARLLRDGVDPNTPPAGSVLTPLHRAIDLAESIPARDVNSKQRLDAGVCMIWLVVAGANVAAANVEGYSPLTRITWIPQLSDVIAILCELGADTESRDPLQKTPLHWVSVKEPIGSEGDQLIRYLLAYGADINVVDNNGRTPLICAVKAECKSRVTQLLNYGVDLTITDVDGCSALSWAVRCGRDASLVKTLCRHGAPLDATINTEKRSGVSCLRYATGKKKREIIRVLLDAGADINVEDQGSFPILTALKHKDGKTARLLLKYKPNIKAKSREFTLPIHLSTFDAELVKMLLEAGSPIDPLDKWNNTPLTDAVAESNKEAAKVLLDAGADVDHEINHKVTILKIAIAKDDSSMIKLLLSYGAQIGTRMGRNRCGYMHFAAYFGHDGTLALLLENGAKVDEETLMGETPLYCAVSGGQRSTVDFLLSQGANLRKRDSSGADILDYAVKHPAMLRFILSQEGFDPNQKDHFGVTSLHVSAYRGCSAGTRILLQHGARQFYAQAFFESSADHLAKDMTKALKGTPAEIARLKGHVEVAELIDNWKHE